MSIESAEIFGGGTFRFNVGPEVKAFILHTKLVSRHSPVFHALMCGNMREAEERQTSLADVDEDTFIRFAEFIYGSDYNVADPLIVLDDLEDEQCNPGSDFSFPPVRREEAVKANVEGDDSAVPPPSPPHLNDEWDLWMARTGKKKKKGPTVPILTELVPFASFTIPSVDTVSFPKIDDSKTGSDIGLRHDYTEVLCHIRLYVFAERYQVNALKNLVIRKLHAALKDTTFHPSRIGQLVDLIQFAYQNTPSLQPVEEPLRSLLTHYVAWDFKELVSVKEFQQLLVSGGPFVNDLCQKIIAQFDPIAANLSLRHLWQKGAWPILIVALHVEILADAESWLAKIWPGSENVAGLE